MDYTGKQIGKYKINRLIGEGGMASVYEGEHEKLGTKAAIKVLNPILSANKQIHERFANEAKMMASLSHTNITKVIDYEETENTMAIVMEYLEGQDLGDYIRQNKKLSDVECKKIFSQILSAFSYAHKQDIVHRDIKPSNIYVLNDGTIKILDFGIAKILGEGNEMTQTGTQIGTPVYMSPEQVRAEKDIDKRSDIYSLGVTLYYALNGVPPYDGNTTSQFAIHTSIVNDPLPEFKVKSRLEPLVKKACEKDKNNRFQNCDQWLAEFEESKENNVSVEPKRQTKTTVKVPTADKTVVEAPIVDKTLIDKPVIEKNAPTITNTAGGSKSSSNKIVLFAVVGAVVVILVGLVLMNASGSESVDYATQDVEEPNWDDGADAGAWEAPTESVYPGRFPQTSERLIGYADIDGLSSWELRVMRNEIFARHGRIFKSEDLRSYFNAQTWYSPRYNSVQSSLTEIERENVRFIKSYE